MQIQPGNTHSCNVKDVTHKPPVELWNVNTRAGKYINCQKREKFIFSDISSGDHDTYL